MNAEIASEDSVQRPRVDRRAKRRLETKDEIVAAAWVLVRENGLAGLSMRDLGQIVGMRAQSIYSYFESKHEIYDAMFHEGYVQCITAVGEVVPDDRSEPVEQIQAYARAFFAFCTSDPVRYQLLFQRTIPGFEPSEASWGVALEFYDSMTAQMADFGITGSDEVDLWTAVVTGFTSQQISNDPGGDRWERLVDRGVAMVLREIAPHLFDTSKGHQP